MRDELRARGRYLGDPQKGLRFQRATIHAGRRSDFYSCSLMIAPVETGLKVHAGNDTTFAGRRETTLRADYLRLQRAAPRAVRLSPRRRVPGPWRSASRSGPDEPSS